MRIISFFVLLSVCILGQTFAAIDVYLQGSVFTEVSSQPKDLFRIGNKVKLYTELTRLGAAQLKCRIWGINQQELNRFDKGFQLALANMVDWVAIEVDGKLFPKGPGMQLSLGSIEVDYSPFTILLKDRAFDDYNYDHKKYYGVAMRNLYFSNFDTSIFWLTGFDDDPMKNMFGGKLSYNKNDFSLAGTYLNYGYRIDNADRVIQETMQGNPLIQTIIESEDVYGLELKKGFKTGFLDCNWVSQSTKYFQRETREVLLYDSLNILKKFEYKMPLDKNIKVILGYRDYPKTFDPILRDRTPEFHPQTGIYLGFNQVDCYRDRKGFYTGFEATNNEFQFKLNISDQKEHQQKATHFRTIDFALLSKVGKCDLDFYYFVEGSVEPLHTNDPDRKQFAFSRVVLTYPKGYKDSTIIPGIEYRKQDNEFQSSQLASFFVRYTNKNLIDAEVGVRQGFANFNGGTYLTLNYLAPNGFKIKYNYSNCPLTRNNGRFYYDPDYRILQPDNLAQISINIDF